MFEESHQYSTIGSAKIRSSILSFLTPEDITSASAINEDWFQAASASSVWQPSIDRASRIQLDAITCLSNPNMFLRVFTVLHESAHEIQSFLSEATFQRYVPHLFGHSSKRYTHQFPLLIVLLHAPQFWLVKLEANRDGYESTALPLLLMAACLRWHVSDPQPGHVYWLTALYEWASMTHHMEFHKIMLAPASLLLRSSPDVCPLSRPDLDKILTITNEMVARFISSSTVSAVVFPDHILTDLDERLIYSIYMLILQYHRPQMEEEVRHALVGGGESSGPPTAWALKIVKLAKLRYDRLRVAHMIAADEREACSDEVVRNLNKKEVVTFSYA